MQHTVSTRMKTIIIGVIALIALGMLVLLFTHHSASKKGVGITHTYNDPVSHQTIMSQDGKAPETNGAKSNAPVFVGFNKLLDDGITVQQVASLQSALQQYKPFASSSTQISLAVDDIQANGHDDTDAQDRFSITSHIVVNRVDTYHIKFYYSGLSAVQLYIYNTDGSQVLFDSGVVDTNASA